MESYVYVLFCVWLLKLNITPLGFIHVAMCMCHLLSSGFKRIHSIWTGEAEGEGTLGEGVTQDTVQKGGHSWKFWLTSRGDSVGEGARSVPRIQDGEEEGETERELVMTAERGHPAHSLHPLCHLIPTTAPGGWQSGPPSRPPQRPLQVLVQLPQFPPGPLFDQLALVPLEPLAPARGRADCSTAPTPAPEAWFREVPPPLKPSVWLLPPPGCFPAPDLLSPTPSSSSHQAACSPLHLAGGEGR